MLICSSFSFFVCVGRPFTITEMKCFQKCKRRCPGNAKITKHSHVEWPPDMYLIQCIRRDVFGQLP